VLGRTVAVDYQPAISLLIPYGTLP